MSRVLRHALQTLRDLLASAAPFVLIAIGLIVLAYWVLDPTPPKHVRLATGPEQSAFEAFGERYAALMRRQGIDLELVPTAGSTDNLERLRRDDGGVDFGFVQGGSVSPDGDDARGLVSLGSLFYEPVWIFYRDSAPGLDGGHRLERLAGLAGWRVVTGPAGSGVPRLFERLLDANRIDPALIERLPLEPTPAVVALLAGQVDAVVFASAPESPLIRMLLQTPGIGLFDFTQADAYERRFGFLSKVVLPRGIVDLGRDLPPQDFRLVATTTTLVAREGTHPALLQLMVQAAAELHGGQGWFNRAGLFPSPEYVEIPVAEEARRFYRSGRPMLQRYLPFWLANLVDRMWVVLAAIVAVLIPLSRLVPPIYEFRVRSRIFRWYAKLRDIEDRLGDHAQPVDAPALIGSLDELDARVGRIHVPLSHADELYALRSHIALVRRRVTLAAQQSPGGTR